MKIRTLVLAVIGVSSAAAFAAGMSQTGRPATLAEMVAHMESKYPGEVTANQKNFILRSLTAQSRKGSDERDRMQKRQLRRENKYLWVIMACATFALIPQIHEFQKDVKRELKREIQQHVMDGQPPSSVRMRKVFS